MKLVDKTMESIQKREDLFMNKCNIVKNILCFTLLIFLIGCVTNGYTASKGTRQYTAYNMWYQKSNRTHCINYQTGTMLPIGTEIRNVKIVRKRASKARYSQVVKRYITFRTVNTGKQFFMYYRSKFHPGVSIDGYLNLIRTSKTKEELTKGMTEIEIEAINRGIVVRGMSKKAVIASVGYPASHYTKNIVQNEWYYWKDRFNNRKLCFDRDGVTVDCFIRPDLMK